jgi:hypothetical protein
VAEAEQRLLLRWRVLGLGYSSLLGRRRYQLT